MPSFWRRRQLEPEERSLPATRATAHLPLVVEPTAASSQLLDEVVAEPGKLWSAMDASGGALLFRGWRVESTADFAAVVAALPIRPLLTDYFPAEPGRSPLEPDGHPLAAVWPTNSRRRTGGYLTPEVLPHSENYYALRPPRLVAFWCERAPWLGGETGLFDAAAALAALPPPLRAHLDQTFAVRRLVPSCRLRRRHGIDDEALHRLARCHDGGGGGGAGVDVRRVDDAVEFCFEKPAVVTAPPMAADCDRDGGHDDDAASPQGAAPRPALCINFSECGACGRAALFERLLRRGMFAGRRWAAHRAVWLLALRWRWAMRLLLLIDQLPGWLRWPARALRRLRERRARPCSPQAPAPASSRSRRSAGRRRVQPRPTLGESLSDRQAEQLGRALADHASVFRWARGDVLLIDNARVMHDGLPGAGPRSLKVAMAGELPLPQTGSHRDFLERLRRAATVL